MWVKGDISGISNMKINVNAGQLSIKTSGVSKVKMNADVTGKAELNFSGVSKFKGKLTSENAIINSEGVSTINLKGRSKEANINASSVGKIKAKKLWVDAATINSSGASSVKISFFHALNAKSTDLSSIKYKYKGKERDFTTNKTVITDMKKKD